MYAVPVVSFYRLRRGSLRKRKEKIKEIISDKTCLYIYRMSLFDREGNHVSYTYSTSSYDFYMQHSRYKNIELDLIKICNLITPLKRRKELKLVVNSLVILLNILASYPDLERKLTILKGENDAKEYLV